MAVDIYLDPVTNDIDLTNNKMRLTRNIEESSRQQVQIVLSCNTGEWFADISFGVPYLENENNSTVLLGKVDKNFLDSFIKDAILSRENIVSIDSYASSLNNSSGLFTVTGTATTTTGTVIPITVV